MSTITANILKADDEIARELALLFCPFYRAHFKYGLSWSYVIAVVNSRSA